MPEFVTMENCRFEIFRVSILHGESSCHFDVLVNMLKCLFWRDILLKNEFEQCADQSPHGNPSGITHEQYANFKQRKITPKTRGNLITTKTFLLPLTK